MQTPLEILVRFALGGVTVCGFALFGDLVRPKSFAGLFGAAPSVALPSLALTLALKGPDYASIECRSMLLGAAGLGVYSFWLCRALARRRARPLPAAVYSLAAWFGTAFGLWFVLLRSGRP